MSHEEFLKLVRSRELESALMHFPSPTEGAERRSVLEIGAGTGLQASMLAARGYNVVAIDLPTSHYLRDRVFDVIDYDGRHIHCASGSMDIVFSSNVLEHVSDIDSFLDETARVMTDDGIAIHIIPTSSCRTWSLPAHYIWLTRRLFALGAARHPDDTSTATPKPKLPVGVAQWLVTLFPPRHGERGTAITEAIYYSKRWWQRTFLSRGFQIEGTHANHIFYTMANALTDKISIEKRILFSRYLGSSCRIYILRKADLGNPCISGISPASEATT